MMKCSGCQQDVPEGRFCNQCGAPLAAAARFGDYESVELLGKGGGTQVYKARHPRINRTVCIKALLPPSAGEPSVVARFEREATMTSALHHPNIVPIIDLGRSSGSPYLVMEFVEGRTLRQLLRDEAPLAAARAIALTDQILAGLAEAHTHGIVHRDLKPGNVMVVGLSDGTEQCKVLDFGIAHSLMDEARPHLTRTGVLLGTPGYLAPEQINSAEFDHRSDLYAAGVLLYEMLVGERMFKGISEVETLTRTLSTVPEAPSKRTTNQVPDALDQVTLKAVAKEPSVRFASATEFREALAAVLGPDGATSTSKAVAPHLDTRPAPIVTLLNPEPFTPRELLASVLNAPAGWERTRALNAFSERLIALITMQQTTELGALLRALQEASREPTRGEAFPEVVARLRAVIREHLEQVIGLLSEPPHAQVATWLLRFLGEAGVGPVLDGLGAARGEGLQVRVNALRLVEPRALSVLESLKGRPPTALKTVVQHLASWPDADAVAFVTAALNLPSAPHRQATLEGLTETLAMRCLSTLRLRLHDPHQPVRAEALRWVFRLEDEGCVGELSKLLHRPSTQTGERKALYHALFHLGAREALIEAVTTEADLDSLAELMGLVTRDSDPDTRELLLEVSKDPTMPVPRRKVIEAGLKAWVGR